MVGAGEKADGTIGRTGPHDDGPAQQCGWHDPDRIGVVLSSGCVGLVPDESVRHTRAAVAPPDGSDQSLVWRFATDEELLQGVIGHELGHAGGVSHLSDPAALMTSPMWSVVVMPADVSAL